MKRPPQTEQPKECAVVIDAADSIVAPGFVDTGIRGAHALRQDVQASRA